jgi:hypothetical protein
MLITKKSIFTGIERTLEINITQDQFDAWKNGMLIQDAMPNISAEDREFVMTGTIKEEWDELKFDDDN